MKKILSSIAIAVTMVLMFAACSEEEVQPTSMTESSVSGSVKIWGYVSYPYKTSEVLKMEGATINVYVDIKQYNDSASGFNRYSTVSDDEGYYEITVPVKKGKSLYFTANTEFKAKQWLTIANPSENAIFQASQTGTVLDGQSININLICTAIGYPDSPEFN